MGQAGDRDLVNAAQPTLEPISLLEEQDTLSGAGSSLLAQPSAALQRLVNCGDMAAGCSVSAFEPPRLDLEALINNPVFSFVLSKRELQAYRQKMDATIRINAVRQYAFEALNWLLRSATQITCVHDVMWWFCAALDKYSRIAPPQMLLDEAKEPVGNENARISTPTASSSAICPGGTSARGARAAFHAFLGSVSALAPSLLAASAAGLQAVRCWALHYSPHDRAFLHRRAMYGVAKT
ncbi:E3 ubiquitin-protein ligase MYCBP2-like isoform X2 [Manduca sexta]|uniref:E3 ubiquitin-protein ligase MYCBP2-like isoform X2 n=1 Tax=Manduca sexta TaxID=7130 RepID=UPI00188EEBE6|nr:E3 ubiquitin-protein ligase MYCBP2-like isoform X2 [Manduca sexta]